MTDFPTGGPVVTANRGRLELPFHGAGSYRRGGSCRQCEFDGNIAEMPAPAGKARFVPDVPDCVRLHGSARVFTRDNAISSARNESTDAISLLLG